MEHLEHFCATHLFERASWYPTHRLGCGKDPLASRRLRPER